MMSLAVRLSILALLAATPAAAQTGDDGTVSLSPAERAAAIDAAARAPRDDLDTGGGQRRIHGEMGVEVGSNGGHALYGTTVVPLGQTGVAAFSFLTANGGTVRRR